MTITITTGIFAQSFDNDACYTVETEEGIVYYQRFEWQQIDYILKFEFHMEMLDADNTWNEIAMIETTDNSVEMPLDSGKYRYKIIVFNLLGQPELESEWIPFEVSKVYQPEITEVSPALVYLEEPQTGVFTLTGKGLLPSSTIVLKSADGISIPASVVETDSKNKELKFFVEPSLFLTGDYTLFVENEGGLSTSFNPFTIKYRKAFDLDVAVGYSCFINIFDNTFEEYFGSRIWPLSATVKISAMPIKREYGYFGLGLIGGYTRFQDLSQSVIEEGYKITGNLYSGYLTFVYQYPFRNKATNKLTTILEAHAGAGFAMLHDITFHFPHNISTDPFNVLYISGLAGGSAQLYFTNRLYCEFNCDFTFSPSADITMGNIVPSLLIGWQF